MTRLISPILVLLLALAACSDDESAITTSGAPSETTTTTSSTTTSSTTTTASPTTTTPAATTSTTGLPTSESNPDLDALAGIWSSETINSWSIRLDGYTIVGGGNPTNLVIPGTVDLDDGVLTVRGLDLGPGGCGEAVGSYLVTHDGNSLTLDLVADDCTRRSETLPGLYAFVE